MAEGDVSARDLGGGSGGLGEAETGGRGEVLPGSGVDGAAGRVLEDGATREHDERHDREPVRTNPGGLGGTHGGEADVDRDAQGRGGIAAEAANRDAVLADTATEGVSDLAGQVERTRGWGGNPDPGLSPEQVAGLQEVEEPVAAANFGAALSGDLGNAEVADESADAPETQEPDLSLGREGGERYRTP